MGVRAGHVEVAIASRHTRWPYPRRGVERKVRVVRNALSRQGVKPDFVVVGRHCPLDDGQPVSRQASPWTGARVTDLRQCVKSLRARLRDGQVQFRTDTRDDLVVVVLDEGPSEHVPHVEVGLNPAPFDQRFDVLGRGAITARIAARRRTESRSTSPEEVAAASDTGGSAYADRPLTGTITRVNPTRGFPHEAEIDHADSSSVRGRFVLVHVVPGHAAARVFAVIVGEESRRRWVRLPGTERSRSQDIRPGGEERVTSVLNVGGAVESVEHRSTFLALDPPTRLQSTYVGIVDDVPRWSSLVDLRFDDTEEGCRVTWSEAFMFSALSADVHDDVAHLVGGTRLRLNGLRALLDEGA